MMTKQTEEALKMAIELLQIQIGELVLQKMRSGNDIPVSRCTITNSEIDALFNDIKKEALEQSKDFVPHEKADAWLVPYLLDIHGARRTSLPEHLHDTFHGTVAWSAEIFTDTNYIEDKYGVKHYPKALYTKSREWNSLTDDEIKEIIYRKEGWDGTGMPFGEFARAIEQALKEKNT